MEGGGVYGETKGYNVAGREIIELAMNRDNRVEREGGGLSSW